MPLSSQVTWSTAACRRWPAAAAYVLLALLPLLVLCTRWLLAVAAGTDAVLADVRPSGRGLGLLWNSIALGAAVSAASTVLGTGLAFWLCGRGKLRRLAGMLYLVPLLIPPYIHALAWMAVAGRRQLLDRLFDALFSPSFSISSYGFLPTVLVLSFSLFPVVTLLARRGLGAIQPELLEAGLLIDTSWRVWRRVVLPLLAPSIVAAAGLVFVLAMVEYGVPALLQYNVSVMEMYASFSQYFDPVRAFSSVLPLVVITTAVLSLSQSGMKNSPLSPRLVPADLGDKDDWPVWARWTLTLCAGTWMLAVFVPVLVLLGRSGGPDILWQAANVSAGELVRTLVVAGVTGVAATAVAVPLALAFMQHMTRLRWLALALPLAVPAPLTAIALIYIWNRPALDWGYGTLLMLVLAHLARFLPFAAFTAFSGIRNIDPLLLEAAALPDVGALKRLVRVTLPVLGPTIVITWFISFVLSLGELGASLLISPPGQATMSMVVYNLLHYGATETVSALALILLLVAGIASAGVLLLHRRLSEQST